MTFAGDPLARRLGLPTIVCYLLAGMAIGPFTPGFVGHVANINQLAELGVIFLMFTVGLHFSLLGRPSAWRPCLTRSHGAQESANLAPGLHSAVPCLGVDDQGRPLAVILYGDGTLRRLMAYILQRAEA